MLDGNFWKRLTGEKTIKLHPQITNGGFFSLRTPTCFILSKVKNTNGNVPR